MVPSFRFKLSRGFIIMFAQQQATWTSGPSLPNHIPEATARHLNRVFINFYVINKRRDKHTNPSDFTIKVHAPIKRLITNPPSTVLISGIPLCLACIA